MRFVGALGALVLLASVGCKGSDAQPVGGRVGGMLERKTFSTPFDHRSTSITLPLGPQTLKAGLRRIDKIDSTNFSWFGTLPNGGTVVLTRRGTRQVGTVFIGNKMYRVEGRPNGQMQIGRVKRPRGKHHAEAFRHGKAPVLTTMAGDIRVLGVYTAKALKACDVVVDIPHAVDLTNEVMTNSKISAQFEDAGSLALEDTFDEQNYQIQDIALNLADEANQDFAPIRAMREEVKADIVMLFIEPGEGADGAAAQTTADKKTAYAVVHCDTALDNLSYVHEIGHLMGLNDDRDLPEESTYPQGYGHTHDSPVEDESWRTIMASGAECTKRCDRIPFLSNPNVMFDGEPTGVAKRSDNADVLRQTAGAISRFF